MFRHQANFFVQLAIHRLFRGLTMLNAALRKLPCMLPHPLAPKHQIPVIRDNNADIRAVAVSVYHLSLYSVNFNSRILSHFHFNEKRNNPLTSILMELLAIRLGCKEPQPSRMASSSIRIEVRGLFLFSLKWKCERIRLLKLTE